MSQMSVQEFQVEWDKKLSDISSWVDGCFIGVQPGNIDKLDKLKEKILHRIRAELLFHYPSYSADELMGGVLSDIFRRVLTCYYFFNPKFLDKDSLNSYFPIQTLHGIKEKRAASLLKNIVGIENNSNLIKEGYQKIIDKQLNDVDEEVQEEERVYSKSELIVQLSNYSPIIVDLAYERLLSRRGARRVLFEIRSQYSNSDDTNNNIFTNVTNRNIWIGDEKFIGLRSLTIKTSLKVLLLKENNPLTVHILSEDEDDRLPKILDLPIVGRVNLYAFYVNYSLKSLKQKQVWLLLHQYGFNNRKAVCDIAQLMGESETEIEGIIRECFLCFKSGVDELQILVADLYKHDVPSSHGNSQMKF